jgi:hypothetical protein
MQGVCCWQIVLQNVLWRLGEQQSFNRAPTATLTQKYIRLGKTVARLDRPFVKLPAAGKGGVFHMVARTFRAERLSMFGDALPSNCNATAAGLFTSIIYHVAVDREFGT